MKGFLLILALLCLTSTTFGQVSGNINFQNQVRYPDNNINIRIPANADLLISVKGLANVKADTYVAIFNVTQVGKTAEEVNSLIDGRISQATDRFQATEGVKVFVDMVSFVPIYEYETGKKIFSKRTYSEVPAGFELKKNIHIEYANPDLLNEIISTFSSAEIYDLVRVDYFSNELESIKKQLRTRATIVLDEKLENYETILKMELDSIEKHLSDGYSVVMPVERYKSYQAYNSSSLNLKKPADIDQAEKSTTLYYQPVIDKEFDFVLNPTILEPVIQVMYELKLNVHRALDKEQKLQKKYMLITPNGELKTINME